MKHEVMCPYLTCYNWWLARGSQMKNEVKCPYCCTSVEINHDDGYQDYQEDQEACPGCQKVFICVTRVTLRHEVKKADCLNGAPHQCKEIQALPSRTLHLRCVDCGLTTVGGALT